MTRNTMGRDRSSGFPFGRLGVSLFLGIAFGLSVHNYILIRLFPPASKRNLVLLAACVLAGWAGYFFLLDRWILPQLSLLKPVQRTAVFGVALLLGLFLMLAGSQAIKASPGSVFLLLPEHRIKVSVPDSQLVPDARIVLNYVKTSTGAVPFSELKTRGWEQKGTQLVLTDFSDNSLQWTGRPGRSAAFIFEQSPRGGYLNVDWGGFTETVNLRSDREGKYLYEHEYPVPLQASGGALLFLLVVNFIAAAATLVLFVWARRAALVPALEAAISPTGEGPAKAEVSRWLWIIGIMLAALLLRVLDLGRPYLYIDEFAHLQAVKQVLSGIPLPEVYQRSLYTVTLPVAASVRLFGFHLWAAKIPGVLVNVLAILPLFLLMEKVHRKAAILTGILFAINPWMIAVSRNVREYAFYPFYFYWIALAMVLFLERIPPGFAWKKDWKKLAGLPGAALSLALVLPLFYGLFVDIQSTFRIVVVAYAVFMVFLAARLGLFRRSNLWVLLAAAAGLVAASILLAEKLYFFSFQAGGDLYPIRYFFPNPEQQWYFERLALLFALAFAAAVVTGILFYRRNFVPLFIAALWIISLLGFMFFFTRFIRPRYLITVQFWFIPLLGFGFHVLWSGFRSSAAWKPAVMWAVILGLAMLGINANQVRKAFTYDEPGVMPITDEYEYSFQSVENRLLGEAAPGEVLAGSFYAAYASWVGMPALETYSLGARYEAEAEAYIREVIEQHDSGWLVLDARYDRGGWPNSTFEMDGKTVEFIGSLDDQLTWRWYKSP